MTTVSEVVEHDEAVEGASGRRAAGLPSVPLPIAIGVGVVLLSVVARVVGGMVSDEIGSFDVITLAVAAVAGIAAWWLAQARGALSALAVIPFAVIAAVHEQALVVAAPVLVLAALVAMVVRRRA